MLLVASSKIGESCMKQKQKNTVCHFRMKHDTAQKLDQRIKRSGFASRTDFFTAVAETALGQASETYFYTENIYVKAISRDSLVRKGGGLESLWW